jgi:hypothetical protein
MTCATVDWKTAQVNRAKLQVELRGELPSRWRKSFRTTARILDRSGEWGEVELKKRTVSVSRLTPGSEEKLRHFIESVVEQANAATERPDDETDADEQGASNGDEAGPDERMTQRFRAFSGQANHREPGVAQ